MYDLFYLHQADKGRYILHICFVNLCLYIERIIIWKELSAQLLNPGCRF